MATKEQNKRWPNASEDAGWLYQWGALGLPVTVMNKASDPTPAGHVTTKENKNANRTADAVPPKVATR